jgi:DTW domain-containing protein YfiP
VSHATEVLVLQHPLEVDHAKNTARLLHLSLSNGHLLVGEVWSEQAVLTAGLTPKATLLLYPRSAAVSDDECMADGVAGCDEAAPELLMPSADLRLVVLDATWRKSRKMLHLSPWLQSLPRLSLDDVPASRYAIRKAHLPGQLSTLEATCVALAQLEGDAQRFQPLLQAFDGFVAQQLAFRPTHAITG